jgi:serine phosphatase RsbU (regulator of sigma subunit)
MEIDTKKGEVIFARAGHESLLFKNAKSKTVTQILPQGIGLGLTDSSIFNANIEETRLSLYKDDLLILYTDGVIEARDENRKEFGKETFIQIVTNQPSIPASEMRRIILENVNTFVDKTPQHDDITMVIVRKL